MVGTKNKPGIYDCLAHALPDEPFFVLLARDSTFAEFVSKWGERRMAAVRCGDRPLTDTEKATEAFEIASQGANWRRQNNGIWRRPPIDGL